MFCQACQASRLTSHIAMNKVKSSAVIQFNSIGGVSRFFELHILFYQVTLLKQIVTNLGLPCWPIYALPAGLPRGAVSFCIHSLSCHCIPTILLLIPPPSGLHIPLLVYYVQNRVSTDLMNSRLIHYNPLVSG